MSIDKNSVIACKKGNPLFTCQRIAEQFGCTREYVRQILNKAGLPTSLRLPKSLCPQCGEPKRRQANLCPACSHKKHWVILQCTGCGQTFERRKSNYKRNTMEYQHSSTFSYSGKVFCNRSCFGRWLGSNYGVGIVLKQQKIRIQQLEDELARLKTL